MHHPQETRVSRDVQNVCTVTKVHFVSIASPSDSVKKRTASSLEKTKTLTFQKFIMSFLSPVLFILLRFLFSLGICFHGDICSIKHSNSRKYSRKTGLKTNIITPLNFKQHHLYINFPKTNAQEVKFH